MADSEVNGGKFNRKFGKFPFSEGKNFALDNSTLNTGGGNGGAGR